MQIRKAIATDADFIKKIHKQHKAHIGSFNLFWSWDHYLDGTNKSKFFVIDGGGFMRYSYSKMYTAYILHEIGVDNETTRKGVGRTLFEALPRPLMLKCNVDNDRGNAFYEAMGMTKMGKTATKKGVEQNVWWIT